MSYSTILVEDDRPLRTIRLNRPEQRNAMTPEMQEELIAALKEAAMCGCRAVVLAGAGEAFCSGLDLSALKAMEGKSAAEHRADAERTARLFRTLYEMPVATIAAVHGPAIAGGAGLAAICDFSLAAPEARFGFTEVKIGFVPALVSVFLALQMGDKRSRGLLLTGRIFSADDAWTLGLVNEVVPAEDLARHVHALGTLLAANSPEAIAATKRLMSARNKAWLDAEIAEAVEASVAAREMGDFREGIAAFLGKRKAVWGK
ncbi:MAG: enoyl-CoA hydratase/isomerase family protein [Terracidiphilus sp.]